MKEEILKELRAAKTIDDQFNVLRKYYELEKTELTLFYKNIFINNLKWIIAMLNVKERNL